MYVLRSTQHIRGRGAVGVENQRSSSHLPFVDTARHWPIYGPFIAEQICLQLSPTTVSSCWAVMDHEKRWKSLSTVNGSDGNNMSTSGLLCISSCIHTHGSGRSRRESCIKGHRDSSSIARFHICRHHHYRHKAQSRCSLSRYTMLPPEPGPIRGKPSSSSPSWKYRMTSHGSRTRKSSKSHTLALTPTAVCRP